MEQIEKTQSVVDLAMLVKAPKTDIPYVVVPDEHTVSSLEHLNKHPARTDESVHLHSAAAFIKYVKKFGDQRSVIFANKDNLHINCVIDYHQPNSPEWCVHKVNYKCPLSSQWLEWNQQNKKGMDQIQFAEFLENHIADIAPVSSGNAISGSELLEMVLAFQETRKSEFKSVRRLQDGTFQMSFSDEKSGGGNTVLPEKICLALPPFHNGASYQVDARIRYRLKDGGLILWFELIEPDKIVEHAFAAVVEEISKELPETPLFEGSL